MSFVENPKPHSASFNAWLLKKNQCHWLPEETHLFVNCTHTHLDLAPGQLHKESLRGRRSRRESDRESDHGSGVSGFMINDKRQSFGFCTPTQKPYSHNALSVIKAFPLYIYSTAVLSVGSPAHSSFTHTERKHTATCMLLFHLHHYLLSLTHPPAPVVFKLTRWIPVIEKKNSRWYKAYNTKYYRVVIRGFFSHSESDINIIRFSRAVGVPVGSCTVWLAWSWNSLSSEEQPQEPQLHPALPHQGHLRLRTTMMACFMAFIYR